MFSWRAVFVEEINRNKEIMEKLLPLEIMKLTSDDLDKQFTVITENVIPSLDEYTTRELVFRFYESAHCRVFNLTGNHTILAISNLLAELPPVYIFHSKLSLIGEEFPELYGLDMINAIYTIDINEYMINRPRFLNNLCKIIEEGLHFYWLKGKSR